MAPCPTYRTPTLLLSGLDSLYVSCYLDVSGSNLDFDELAYLKERVQASRIDDFEEVELGSETLALKSASSPGHLHHCLRRGRYITI